MKCGCRSVGYPSEGETKMTIDEGRVRVTIDAETLKRYVAEGLTTTQMAERFLEETGEKLTPSAFAVHMFRKGIKSARPRPRYTETLPWVVRAEHSNSHVANMLRTLGARDRGDEVPVDRLYRLERWLDRLDNEGTVIHYDPETKKGFWEVPREKADKNGYIHVRGIPD